MDTPIIVVATITLQPGSREVAEAALRKAVALSRKEPGCDQYQLHEDSERADRLVMIERWRDEAALKGHLEGPVFRELAETIEGHITLDVMKLSLLV